MISSVEKGEPEPQASSIPHRKTVTMRKTLGLFLTSAVTCFVAVIFFLFLAPGTFPSQALTSLRNIGKPTSNSTTCHGWNILYHLGGNGPWIRKVDGVVPGGIAVPDGCHIDMVHMMSRHGERFPTKSSGARMLDLVNRIKMSGIKLQGTLAFLNTWSYFTDAPDLHFDQLTKTGPYAGTLETFTAGVKFRTRYQHLWNDSTKYPLPTVFWASDSERVVDTAKYFAAGFFGIDYDEERQAKLVIIPETEDRGGDTLTPGVTCKNFVTDTENGHDLGRKRMDEFKSTYLGDIAKRLEKSNPGFNFTQDEIFSMQEMCGFETTVRGSSQWCHAFTKKEWLAFEYARDVMHYYKDGPGNPYGAPMGWLWLNATANLIQRGPEAGPIFFTFAHDGDIVPMLASLGILDDHHPLSTTHLLHHRRWKTSQIVPMGGKIVLERMTCPSPPGRDAEQQVFVRFNINDGIVALPGCSSGPGGSCPLERFMEHVAERGKEGGDFRKVCGLGENVADRLSFLKQPGRD